MGGGGKGRGDIDEMKKESISPDHLPHVHPLLAVLFTATCVLAPCIGGQIMKLKWDSAPMEKAVSPYRLLRSH